MSQEFNLSNKKPVYSSSIKIGQAAKILGVSIDTLRRWEKSGKLPSQKTPGGTRFYSFEDLKNLNPYLLYQKEGEKSTPEAFPAPTGITPPEILQSWAEIISPPTQPFLKPLFLALSFVLLLATTGAYLILPFQLPFKDKLSKAFPQLAEKLEVKDAASDKPQYATLSESLLPQVLGESIAAGFLEINSETRIQGPLIVRDTINNLTLQATPSAGLVISGGGATLKVTKDATLDQNLSITSDVTFDTLNLSATSNQLIFQAGGPTGTLTWTPTAARVITLPDATTTLVGKDTTDTLKNKSISGSDNTLTAIPNSALSNSKVTVTAGTNLSGGGDVSLGSSVTLSLASSPAISGVLKLADGSASAPSLTFTDDTNTGLYRIGTDSIAMITGGSVTSGLVINSSGFIGVGTSSPAARLSVAGNVGIGSSYANYAPPANGLIVEGNVGIGNTSPSQTFQVNPSGTSSFVVTSTGNVGIGFTTPTSLLQLSSTASQDLFRVDDNGPGDTSPFVIASDGNVGIANSAPSYVLDVIGATRFSTNITQGAGQFLAADGSSSLPAYSFSGDTDTGLWRIGANQIALTTGGAAMSGLAINSSGNVGIGNTSASQLFQINPSGTSAVVVTSSGNVGIGFTSPDRVVQIASDIDITSSNASLLGAAGTQFSITGGSATGLGKKLVLGIDTTDNYGVIQAGILGTNYSLSLNPAGGNVGIGTTSPTSNLHVVGTANVTSNTTIGGTLGVTGVTTLSANNAALSFTGTTPSLTSGSSVFGIFAGGNVGIGTTGNVYGGLTVRGGGTSTGITLQTYGSGLGQGLTVLDNGNVGIGNTNPGGSLIVQSGNVGIGHTLPTANLHVLNTASQDSFRVDDATGDTSPFVIASDGNVGIANSAPSYTLDVVGTGRFSSTLTASNGLTLTTGALNLTSTSGAANLALTSATNAFTVNGLFGVNTTSNLVGIGTTAPGATLHVYDASGTVARFERVGSSQDNQWDMKITADPTGAGNVVNSGSLTFRNITSAADFAVVTTGTGAVLPNFVIKATTGNVGIGHTTPTAALHLLQTGSGNAFRVDDVLGDTSPFVIASDGNVGIANSAPSYALDVVGGARVSSTAVFNGVFTLGDGGDTGEINTSDWDISTTGAMTGIGAITADGVLTLSASNAALSFTGSTPSLTSGSAVFGLFAGGNVGIGTTGNVYGGLTVRGAGTGTNITFQTYGSGLGQGLTVLDNGNVGIGNTGPVGSLIVQSGNVGIGTTLPTANLHVLNTASQDSFRVDDALGDTSPFVIASDGNVGIANSAPSYTLDVIGATRFSTNITQGAGQFLAADGTASLPAYSFSGDTDTGLWRIGANQIALTTAGAAMSGLAVNSSGNVGIGNTSASQLFQVNASGTSAFVVTSTGNVGIGFTSPDRLLQLAVDANPAGTNASLIGTAGTTQLALTGSTANNLTKKLVLGIDTTDNYGVIQAGTSGTNYNLFLNPAGGNVGIGTTNTTRLLSLRGGEAAIFMDDLIGRSVTYLGDNQSANDSNGVLQLFNEGTSTIFLTAASTAVSYFNAGNIGIGTTTPGSALTVIGNVGIGTSAAGAALQVNGGGLFGWGTTSVAAPSNGLGISGNVGIGTTSPTSNLHVIGTATITGATTLSANNAALSFTGTTPSLSTSNGSFSLFPSTGNVGIGTSSVGGSLIVNTGNVGIGFTSPLAMLQVSSTASQDLFRVDDNGAGDTSPFVIASDGNVGIANSAPSYALDVVGGARVSSTAVFNGVFTLGDGGDTGEINTSDWDISTTGAMTGIGAITADGVLTLSASNAALSFTGSTPSLTSGSAVFGLFAGGNVGIGTTGNVYGGLTVRGAGTGTNITFQTYGSGLGQGLTVLDNGNVGIGNTNPAGSLIVASGNVGIGFTSPDRVVQIASDIDIVGSNASLLGAAGTQFSITGGSAAGLGKKLVLGIDTTNNYGVIQAGTAGTNYDLALNPAGGNVGIGTTSPAQKLEVSGGNIQITGGTPFLFVKSTTGSSPWNDGLYIQSNVDTTGNTPGNYSTFLNPSGKGFTFMQGTTSKMVMDTTGNLGIGDSAPSNPTAQLYISQTDAGDALRVEDSGGDTSPFVIASDGNVGIANSAPSYALDVVGGARVSSTAVFNGAFTLGDGGDTGEINTSDWDIDPTGIMTGIGAITSNGLITTTGGLTVTGAAVSLNASSDFDVNIATGTSTGDITLGGGTAGQLISINSDDWDITTTGAMTGIGAITADGLLTLSANNAALSFTGTTPSLSTSNGSFSLFPSTGNVGIGTSSVGGSLIVFSGNVGIGFTSPIAMLQVSSTASQDLFRVDDNGAGDTSPFVIASDGNVGIANSAPSYALDVVGGARVSSTAVFNGAFTLGDGGDTGEINTSDWDISPTGAMTGIGAITADGVLTLSASNAALSFTGSTPSLTSGSAVFGLFAGGNVGIGTTGNVYGGLTVRGLGTSTGITLQTYGSGLGQGLSVLDNGNVGIGTTAAGAALQVNGGGLFGWGTASVAGPSNGLGVEGNVGIGTTSPTAPDWSTPKVLEIAATGTSEPILALSNAVREYQIGVWEPEGSLSIYDDTGNAHRIILNTDGNVGIGGDSTPDNLFAVGSTSQFQVNSSGYALLPDGAAATPALTFTGDTNTGLWRIGADQLALTTAGAAMSGLAINSSGNVGIGNTSASQLFQINPSGTSAVVVTSGGNVGIGFTSPTSLLYVSSTAVTAVSNLLNVSSSQTAATDLGAGMAAQFTRANTEFLSITDNPSLSMGDIAMSMGMWVYFDSTANGISLAGKWASGNVEYLLYYVASPARFRFIVRNTGNTTQDEVVANTFGAPAANTWYFVTVYHNPTTNLLGISVNDGAFDTRAWTGGIRDSDSAFTLGAQDTAGTAPHDGRIDSAGVWKKILSAAEITWLYNSGAGRRYNEIGVAGNDGSALKTSLEAFWELEEASGTRKDSYGSNNLSDNATVTSNPGVIKNVANLANFSFSPTYTNVGTAVTSPSVSAQVLNVSRSVTTDGTFGSTLSVYGALAAISDSATQNQGTLTHTANVLDITQNYTSSSGTALYVKNYGGASSASFRVDDVSSDATPFIIDSSGNVGIGATNPTGAFQVGSSAAAPVLFVSSLTGNVGIGTTGPSAPLEVKATGTGTIAKFTSNNTTGCTLADGGTITCTSDIRLKKNIDDLSYGLSDLMKLRPVGFNWKSDADSMAKSLGFIAQEVETVIPQLVITDSGGFKELNTIGMVPILTRAIQQQQAEINRLADQTSLQASSSATLTAGDLVSPSATESGQLVKTSTPYDDKVLGVITNDTAPYSTALSGKAQVKVSTENGLIEVGDPLTSSSIPGVAMSACAKASADKKGTCRPGQVVGKALEPFVCSTSEESKATSEVTGTGSSDGGCQGKILTFINVSFADPTNVLANLTLDADGSLIIPQIKTGKLVISQLAVSSTEATGSAQLTYSATQGDTQWIDVAARLVGVESLVWEQETKIATVSAQLADLESRVVSRESWEASASAQIASMSAQLAQLSTASSSAENSSPSLSSGEAGSQQTADLNLTPPETLLATGSAQLAKLNITDTLSTFKLTALEATVSGTLKSLGDTFLGKTIVAGDLVQDGTLSITGGNTINAISTLYLQSSTLTQAVSFFNGLVTIDKEGRLVAQTISASEFKATPGKSVGTGKILAGIRSVDITTPLVKSNSRILITPTIETSLSLAVTTKVEGQKFTVSIPVPTPSDIDFDWFLINESN